MHDGSARGQTRPPLQRLRFVCPVRPCQESGMVPLSAFFCRVSTQTQVRVAKDTEAAKRQLPTPNFQLPTSKESHSRNEVKAAATSWLLGLTPHCSSDSPWK